MEKKIIKVEKDWEIQIPQDILEAMELKEGDKVSFEVVKPGVISMEKA